MKMKKAQAGIKKAVKKVAPKMMAGEMTGKMYKKSELDEIGKKQAAELDKSGVFGKAAMAKKKTPKAKSGGKFGMLSVKAGIDKNPNPTAADRIAGAKGMAKSGKKVAKKMMKNGGMLAAPTKGGVSMQLGTYTRQIGKNYTGKNVVNKGAKAKMGKSVGKCKSGC